MSAGTMISLTSIEMFIKRFNNYHFFRETFRLRSEYQDETNRIIYTESTINFKRTSYEDVFKSFRTGRLE
jgi:hypothetical protein